MRPMSSFSTWTKEDDENVVVEADDRRPFPRVLAVAGPEDQCTERRDESRDESRHTRICVRVRVARPF